MAELEEIVEGLPKCQSQQTIHDNRILIKWLGERRRIISLIREVLTKRSLLEEVACRSYRHINLFDKIVLVGNENPQEYRLTLHFWNPPYTEVEVQQELIHEHRFNFWSVILTGSLVSENFERAANGRAYRQYRYVPELIRSRTFSDFYEYCSEVKLQNCGRTRKTTGESYYLSAPKIHRIILPRNSMSCTLVLRGPRLKEYSHVYNTTYPNDNTHFANAMFSESELAVRLHALLDRMGVCSSDWPEKPIRPEAAEEVAVHATRQ